MRTLSPQQVEARHGSGQRELALAAHALDLRAVGRSLELVAPPQTLARGRRLLEPQLHLAVLLARQLLGRQRLHVLRVLALRLVQQLELQRSPRRLRQLAAL